MLAIPPLLGLALSLSGLRSLPILRPLIGARDSAVADPPPLRPTSVDVDVDASTPPWTSEKVEIDIELLPVTEELLRIEAEIERRMQRDKAFEEPRSVLAVQVCTAAARPHSTPLGPAPDRGIRTAPPPQAGDRQGGDHPPAASRRRPDL